jgi:hypothetical protein
MQFQGNFRLRYQKNTKQITLLRNILASIVYERRGLKLEDCLVLYDLLPQMVEKAEKDLLFYKSHGSKLIIAYEIIKNKVNPTTFPFKAKKDVVEEIKTKLYGWIPSETAYFGWSKNPKREKSYEVIPVSLKLKLPKIQKQVSRIGVGYRDKGYLKNQAVDGSPSWKVSGKQAANLERLQKEDPVEFKRYSDSLPKGEKQNHALEIIKMANNLKERI